jgi:death-on-curing protein
MLGLGEVRFGVFDRALLQSSLARPQQAAAYENADLPSQAATLCFGLIKNHPFVGGNKRTATHLTDRFLKLNGFEIAATISELVEVVLEIESGRQTVEDLTRWMREHTQRLTA